MGSLAAPGACLPAALVCKGGCFLGPTSLGHYTAQGGVCKGRWKGGPGVGAGAVAGVVQEEVQDATTRIGVACTAAWLFVTVVSHGRDSAATAYLLKKP
jgi:hypothetical protein